MSAGTALGDSNDSTPRPEALGATRRRPSEAQRWRAAARAPAQTFSEGSAAASLLVFGVPAREEERGGGKQMEGESRGEKRQKRPERCRERERAPVGSATSDRPEEREGEEKARANSPMPSVPAKDKKNKKGPNSQQGDEPAEEPREPPLERGGGRKPLPS